MPYTTTVSEKDAKSSFTLAELAEETQIPRRTIRYYIARGLLPGPEKAGRNSVYGPDHLERLRRIVELQSEGLTLAEITHRLAGAVPEQSLPEPVAWQAYAVAPDVTVQVRAGAAPWRMKQIREALRDLQDRLAREGGTNDARNL